MPDTPQTIKAGNIKWSKNAQLTLSSLDSETFAITNYVVTSANYSGDNVDLLEVNDITDNKMSKDYVFGMDDGGTLDLTLQGLAPGLKIRTRWTMSLSIDGVSIFQNKIGVVTNAQQFRAESGQPASTQIQFKVLPANSRLGAVKVVPEPAVSNGSST